MNLREWQENFRSNLKQGGFDSSLFVESTSQVDLKTRFKVYSQAHWIRVSRSLSEDFPLLSRVLGKRLFTESMREFVRGYNGTALELGGLAGPFAEFLRGKFHSEGARLAVELDLAALEARSSPEHESSLQGRFGLHSSVRVVERGPRRYVLWWRAHEVLRERIDEKTAALLACFSPAGTAEEVAQRLEARELEAAFTQEAVAAWMACGVIGPY